MLVEKKNNVIFFYKNQIKNQSCNKRYLINHPDRLVPRAEQKLMFLKENSLN